MRNLNATEIHGRQLRVDSAASQKQGKEEESKNSKCVVTLMGLILLNFTKIPRLNLIL